jgi:hypothetical protein
MNNKGGLTQPVTSDDKQTQTVWNLENAYWRYAQENDRASYLTLWHEDFLGWPDLYPAPVHKDHIADWMASVTTKGLTLKLTEFKPAGIQVTGSVAVTCYWITLEFLDKDSNPVSKGTFRILHTWIKNRNNWQIIAGMSMPEPVTTNK